MTDRIPLPVAAKQIGMSSMGLRNLLRRRGDLVQDGCRWFCPTDVVAEIKAAREVLRLHNAAPAPAGEQSAA